jgi:hypothetical protein
MATIDSLSFAIMISDTFIDFYISSKRCFIRMEKVFP